jgi:hypothetical protein
MQRTAPKQTTKNTKSVVGDGIVCPLSLCLPCAHRRQQNYVLNPIELAQPATKM